VGGMEDLRTRISAGAGELTADVVVVGTGPVGLAVALGCRGSGRRILLVDSGGRAPDTATDDLATGERAQPFSMLPIPTQQARCVGGNSNLWHLRRPDASVGVRMVELDDVDFERRPATGGVGWPFAKEHLRRWYRAAADALGITDFATITVPNGIETAAATTKVAQVPLAATVYVDWVQQLLADPDVSLLTGATATRVLTDPERPGRITGIEVTTLDGAVGRITATDVVIAGGGYDNARFLLMQDRIAGTPLGDDTVTGRYLQDHPLDFGDHLHVARHAADRPVFARDFDMQWTPAARPEANAGQVARIAFLTLRSEYAAAHDLLGMSTWLFPRRWALPIDKGPAALRYLVGRGVAPAYPGSGRTSPADRARAAVTLAANLPSLAHWASGERLFVQARTGPGLNRANWPADGSRGRFRTWELVRLIEQPPRHDNRVRLSTNTDRLGRARILIDWTWSPHDAHAALRTKTLIDDVLRPLGVRFDDERLALCRPGTGHIVGSTRMHPDPRHGVVDEHCRVHGLANLHVVGSSVFPTGGWANPTFTAIALAMRLGHTLGCAGR